MKHGIWYRVAAVLLLLFAVGHTIGFSQVDPLWKVDALVAAMRATHFDMMGFQRTYWDLFLATGYTVGLFFLFCSVLAWQLGGLPVETLRRMRVTIWGFALTFVAVLAVSVIYLFIVPIIFSSLIALSLFVAAWAVTSSRAG